MKYASNAYRIFPLGDSALTIDFGNTIDETINQHVLDLFVHFRASPLPGMIEAVPAYSSLTLYYDLLQAPKPGQGRTVFDQMKASVEQRLATTVADTSAPSRQIDIPVCYDAAFGPDLEWLAREKNLTTGEVIRLHTSRSYRVYMLGFLPGFSYLGNVDQQIEVARKPEPVMVAPGSVGIAGRQTGVYPMLSPGGWQIIGRTPIRLFDAEKEPFCLLQPGYTVRFFQITQDEFANY